MISCLTATYGRFTLMRRTLAFFLVQDYQDKELIILNNHPVPLACNQPGVTIVNEPGYATVGECRNRLLDFARGEFVRTWDDDDGYFPWTLSQGAEHIGDAPAFKPARSWFYTPSQLELSGNAMEASILVRAEVARRYGYQHTAGDEHLSLLRGIDQEGGCKIEELGVRSSYAYHWGWGNWHLSGSLGNGTAEARSEIWKYHHTDTGDGQELMPIDLTEYYETFARRLADVTV